MSFKKLREEYKFSLIIDKNGTSLNNPLFIYIENDSIIDIIYGGESGKNITIKYEDKFAFHNLIESTSTLNSARFQEQIERKLEHSVYFTIKEENNTNQILSQQQIVSEKVVFDEGVISIQPFQVYTIPPLYFDQNKEKIYQFKFA